MKHHQISYRVSGDGETWSICDSIDEVTDYSRAPYTGIAIQFFYAKSEITSMMEFVLKMEDHCRKLAEYVQKEGLILSPKVSLHRRAWNNETDYVGDIAVYVSCEQEGPIAAAKKLQIAAAKFLAEVNMG